MNRILVFYRALSERGQRVTRVALYAALGLLVFIIGLYASFPWEKATDRLAIALSQATDMDVSIGHVGPSFWPGVTLRDVVLRSRPVRPDDHPASLHIDRITVHPGLWAALTGSSAVSFSIDAGGGTIEGQGAMAAKSGSQLDLAVEDVHLDKIDGLTDLSGLPVGGPLEASLSINVPAAGISKATGTVHLSCDGCTLGDGVHDVHMPGAATAGGFTLPRIRLGHFDADVGIAGGLATIKTFHAKSEDGELFVQGSVNLANPLPDSKLEIFMRFRVEPAIASNERLQFLLATMGPGKREDGFYGERLMGTFRMLRMMPSKEPLGGPSSPFVAGMVTPPTFRPPPMMRSNPPIAPPVQPAPSPPVPPPVVDTRGMEAPASIGVSPPMAPPPGNSLEGPARDDNLQAPNGSIVPEHDERERQ